MNPGLFAGYGSGLGYESLPVGTVLQSPINLERITDGKFIAMDGRDCLRSQYPQIAEYFPGGVFTGTARNLNSSPAAASIATNDDYFVALGAGGTANHLQYSSSGVTWAPVTIAAAPNTILCCVIRAGARMIAAGTAAGSGADAYSTDGLSWAQIPYPGSGGAGSNCLAYSPQLGRTVRVPAPAGTTIHTLEDGATTWVSRSHTTSRTKKAVVWTGQRFIVFTSDDFNTILISTDGITWVEQVVSQPLAINTAAPNPAASNGNGVIVVFPLPGIANNAIVSHDHGVTWSKVMVPQSARVSMITGVATYVNYNVFFLNGKFITVANGDYLSLISVDGKGWQEEPITMGRGPFLPVTALAYKSGVYCGLRAVSTTAGTWTEDMSKFRMFDTAPPHEADTCALHMEYMKVRM